MAALRVRDIDLGRGRIRVERSASKVNSKTVIGTTKTHAARSVAVSAWVLKLLAPAMVGKSPDELLWSRADGQPMRPRVNYRSELVFVRAFYEDIARWAADDPSRWAPWVAPCPIPDNALRGLSVQKRRTKERIDDRIRQRQPLLPTLVAHLEDRYHHLREILRQASSLAPCEAFAVEGRSYQRAWSLADDKRLEGREVVIEARHGGAKCACVSQLGQQKVDRHRQLRRS
jgi:hypothetical protein